MNASAKEILDRRLASGEIQLTEYNSLLERLSETDRLRSSQQAEAVPAGAFAAWNASRRPLPTSGEQYRKELQKADYYLLTVYLLAPILAYITVYYWAQSDWGQDTLRSFAGLFSGAPKQTIEVIMTLLAITSFLIGASVIATLCETLLVPLPFVDAPSEPPKEIMNVIAAHNAKPLTFTNIGTVAKKNGGVSLVPTILKTKRNTALFIVCFLVLVVG